MDVTNILRRLAALSDPQDDDMQWVSALATDALEHGLAEDEDPSATAEAAQETKRIVKEIRELATAARQMLEA